MIAGCYSLDLYCDATGPHNEQSFPAQYTAEAGGACRDEARADGWKIHQRQNIAICPSCARAGHTLTSVRLDRIKRRAIQARPLHGQAAGLSEDIPFSLYIPGDLAPD